MDKVNFSMEENGYSVEEVDKYIEMIQKEYESAVVWGEDTERQLNGIKKDMEELGVYFTIDEDNQSEVIEKVFTELTATVTKVKNDAQAKAEEIVLQANERARNITRLAMENSVKLRTENNTIMKNLRSINEMIDVILEKNIQ